jgi:HlyD family secretion protein
MQVLAPADATIEILDVRPGDLIAPNAPLATLLERNQLYVRVYVPETRIGHVHLGQPADLFVDSFPNHPFKARVEQINQQAEFLPRNVQTADERVHQVIGVKLRIDDPENRLRAGMAATVKLRENSR